MTTFKERVEEELFSLQEKRDKLGVFLTSEKSHELPAAEQVRLSRQYDIMDMYEDILLERLEQNFGVDKDV